MLAAWRVTQTERTRFRLLAEILLAIAIHVELVSVMHAHLRSNPTPSIRVEEEGRPVPSACLTPVEETWTIRMTASTSEI
jgi:hypothetical protein